MFMGVKAAIASLRSTPRTGLRSTAGWAHRDDGRGEQRLRMVVAHNYQLARSMPMR